MPVPSPDIIYQYALCFNDKYVKAQSGASAMTTFQNGGEERLTRICEEYGSTLETVIDTNEVERAAGISAVFASELATSVFHQNGVPAAVDTLQAVLFEAELARVFENLNANEADVVDALNKADTAELTSLLSGNVSFFRRLLRRFLRLFGR